MFADHVIPFVFESLPVRGEIIHLSRAWRRMLRHQDHDPLVQKTLGHAAAATGLIAQSLKFDGAVTMQIQGSGDLRMLVMQCTSALELRGTAHASDTITAGNFGELVQDAHCAITVDAGERPYQGIVAIDSDSLGASLENYFAQSVQVPSHVVLVSDETLAGGILLQRMPGQEIDDDDWDRLGFLAATLKTGDFPEANGLALISKLFNEDDVRVFEGKPVVFRCRCSKKRAEEILRMLGEQEVRDALKEQARLDVTCEYCGRLRKFDTVDVSRVFATNVVAGPDRIQ
ncbi:MAG TPA: Hsp33 family molecular chaperone HslO [Woeseiaceae bacterium]|nr:Hsp33 family molecular chaperone HslO [Woeseiaceae bacterium]